MRANVILLASIVCFAVGACGSPGVAPAEADQFRAAPAIDQSNFGLTPVIPHDYPGPALRGGNGGG